MLHIQIVAIFSGFETFNLSVEQCHCKTNCRGTKAELHTKNIFLWYRYSQPPEEVKEYIQYRLEDEIQSWDWSGK